MGEFPDNPAYTTATTLPTPPWVDGSRFYYVGKSLDL